MQRSWVQTRVVFPFPPPADRLQHSKYICPPVKEVPVRNRRDVIWDFCEVYMGGCDTGCGVVMVTAAHHPISEGETVSQVDVTLGGSRPKPGVNQKELSMRHPPALGMGGRSLMMNHCYSCLAPNLAHQVTPGRGWSVGISHVGGCGGDGTPISGQIRPKA